MSFQIFVTFTVLIVYANASYVTQIALNNCFPCQCRNVTANCSDRNLIKVPVLRSNITHIILSRNTLTALTRKIFEDVTALNITKIELNYCKVMNISNDTFLDFPMLTHLNISGNKRLPIDELSQALAKTKLTQLSLDDAGLDNMLEAVRFPFKHVRRLILRKNRIYYVNTTSLSYGFPALRNLDLTNNRLQTFPFTAILNRIEILNLAQNRIESNNLQFCVNGSVNKLRMLDLSWNYLSDISVFKSEGHCLSQLGRLVLNNNYHIFKIPDNVFSRLPRVKTMLFRYVNERVDIEPLAFNVSTLRELRLTTSGHLILQLKHVNMLKLCPNLRTLHFTSVIFNGLQDNLTDMFSHLVHMKDFKIKYGMVSNISFLSTMKQLTNLYLLGNNIKSWNPEIFTNMPLKELILAGNQIPVFDQNVFPSHIWDNLKYFSTSGNPFECSCELLWFKKWLADNTEKLSAQYPKLYVCLYPEKWKEKTVVQYEPDGNECKPAVNALIVIGIGLGSLAGVLLLLAIIVYKGRYHIKHRMYLVRSLQPYNRLPDGEEFVYDAFVAHHVDNRLWVINHLLPFLEKQRKLRLCLHERDFLPGNFIADNIVNNMTVSRKVILVFSEDFADSEWCQFEARNAYQRIIVEGTSSVVIVMLEDISHRPVNDTIRNLMHTVPYIEWGNERSNRPEFFRKLLDALK